MGISCKVMQSWRQAPAQWPIHAWKFLVDIQMSMSYAAPPPASAQHCGPGEHWAFLQRRNAN